MIASSATLHEELVAFAGWLEVEQRLLESIKITGELKQATTLALQLIQESGAEIVSRLAEERKQERLLNSISDRLVNFMSAFIFPSVLEFTTSPKGHDLSKPPDYSITANNAHSDLTTFESWLALQIHDVGSLDPVSGDVNVHHTRLLGDLKHQAAVLVDARVVEWNKQVNWDPMIPIINAGSNQAQQPELTHRLIGITL